MNPQDFDKLEQLLDKKLKEELQPIKERMDSIEGSIEEILLDKAQNRLDIMVIKATTNRLDKDVGIMKLDVKNLKIEAKSMEERFSNQIKQSAKDVTEDIVEVIKQITDEAVSQEQFKDLERQVDLLKQN